MPIAVFVWTFWNRVITIGLGIGLTALILLVISVIMGVVHLEDLWKAHKR